MTDDFKIKVLKYLTGNLVKNEGNNIPNFSEVSTITNNLYNYMNENFSSFGSGNYLVLDGIQGLKSGEGLSLSVIYGLYNQVNSVYNNGFVIIVDEEYNPVQLITSFDNGVQLNKIQIMNVDENGEFFMIDEVDGKFRFIMLNNILLKRENEDYKMNLRKSYFFPSEYNPSTVSSLGIQMLKKVIGSSYYLMIFNLSQSGDVGNSGKASVLTLKVNVGSENEWKIYSYNQSADFRASDIYISYDSNNLNFRLGGQILSMSDYKLRACEFLKFDSDDIVFRLYNVESKIFYYNNTIAYGYNVSFPSANNVKFLIYKFYLSDEIYSFEYDELWSYETSFVEYGLFDTTIMRMLKVNNEVFFEIMVLVNDDVFEYQLGRIIGDNVYAEKIGNFTNSNTFELTNFFVYKQYNLYRFYIQAGNEVYIIYQVYNSSNFNGVEYENINSLLPKYSNLYNDDNEIVFSRNLYNKVINENTTTSTIEVPNVMLNDSTIVKEELVSDTNTSLIINQQNVVKNIYETLYFNFINSVSIYDNNKNNKLINKYASSMLNKSINNVLDYDDIKLSKIKINYSDGTNEVEKVSTVKISDYKYNIFFNFYVKKNVDTIEFISEDEKIIYLNINANNLQINNLYKISQNVEVV